ncbi:unnamed protein product [Tuber aestivum]|uniref:DUF7871 domain-containing protein n=1 Tax=Tuber aestivum TaxID=59557 RepID=A0A292PJX7_9PEZI|nr:unnamed protein product [Tuber aestivum]
MVVNPPPTCCKKTGGDCTCAQQAKCSCGQKEALNCTCERAPQENKVEGARLRRPAKQCTCERAAEENTVTGDSCECGLRRADACYVEVRRLIDYSRHMREESERGLERGRGGLHRKGVAGH